MAPSPIRITSPSMPPDMSPARRAACAVLPSVTAKIAAWALALVAGACCLLASGCGGVPIDSPAPDKDQVLEYVAASIPSEDFELLDYYEVQELPQQVVYIFRSTERDLTFTALSEIAEGGYSLFYTPPKPRITCYYPQAVRDLYEDRARAALGKALLNERDSAVQVEAPGCYCYVRSYSDLEAVVRAAVAADAVYQEEFEYNSPEWCRENVSDTIYVRWTDGTSDEDGDPSFIEGLGMIDLTGSFDAEAALEELSRTYARLIYDGDLPDDPTLPEGYLEGLHPTFIERITVNGREVPFELDRAEEVRGTEEANPYQEDRISHGRGGVIGLDEDTGEYVIYIDIGDTEWVDEADPDTGEQAERLVAVGDSWLIRQVTELAGGTYSQDGEYIRWQIGETQGEIHVSIRGTGGLSAMLIQEGRAGGLDRSDILLTGADYVQLTVSEFAEIMGLEYRIDEDTRTLELTTPER